MIEPADVRRIRDELPRRTPPVLTLYLRTNPADPDNAQAAWRLRAKEALKELELPPGLSGRVLEQLEYNSPPGRTLFLLADEKEVLEVRTLAVDLAESAHWGDPYLTPLLEAIDKHERYAVVVYDTRSVRLFTAFLGEIEERTSVLTRLDEGRWRAVQESLDATEQHIRHGPEADRLGESKAARRHRALRDLAGLLEHALPVLDANRLVLAGPGERPRELRDALPERLREQVAGEIGLGADASPAELLARLSEVEANAGCTAGEELLRSALERGVRGLEATLQALQEGRVHQLLVPWPLERTVGRCESCLWIAAEPGRCPACGGEAVPIALDELVPGLAEQTGARLELIEGEARERLEEIGGLAGVVRF